MKTEHIFSKIRFVLIVFFAFAGILTQNTVMAQSNTDSIVHKSQDNAIFLNASSDAKPREISLGLPTNSLGAVHIFEDGMPVSYYIYHVLPYMQWHGGMSAESSGTMAPMETALRNNEIGNYVDSYNRTGSDKLSGRLNYTIGSYGQNKFDINLAGPLGHGWEYSVSSFQNFDPGSNHNVYPDLKDRHQFYKAVLSKSFGEGRGYMSFVYQYVNYLSYSENFGPFIFNNDGSVRELDGFSLGTDSYRPELSQITYLDFRDGQMRTESFNSRNRQRTHSGTFTLKYDFDNGWHLDTRSRFRQGIARRGNGSLAGIENVKPGNGQYTYEDGTEFSGNLQRRSAYLFDAFGRMWMNNVELSKKIDSQKLRLGFDYAWSHDGTVTSSTMWAHEVKANAKVVLHNGQIFDAYNSAGEYYDGDENRLALYIKDEWTIASGRELSGFIRAQYRNMNGEALNNVGNDKSNSRYPGFSIPKGKKTPFNENFLEGAAGLDLTWRLGQGFSAKAQSIFTRTHSTLFNYGGYQDPSTAPIDTKFAQAGISYQNKWLNLVSQLVYISQTNYNSRQTFQHALQKPVGNYPAGYIESVLLPIIYGIESLGWTTDALITPFKGMSIHAQFTVRDPKYRDFVFKPLFSDGVEEEYDFSGNNVTGLHKVEFQLDPSYSYRDWRFWLSARYIGKQYINKTNSLYFKERIETFGGIDYTLSKYCRLSLNVINILNQKGASGTISSADLAEDASGYDNYLMAGTFIRPFTVELSVNINF